MAPRRSAAVLTVLLMLLPIAGALPSISPATAVPPWGAWSTDMIHGSKPFETILHFDHAGVLHVASSLSQPAGCTDIEYYTKTASGWDREVVAP